MTRLITIVGEGGLEPPRPEGHWHLKPARLPFRHSPGKQPMDHITVMARSPNRRSGPGCQRLTVGAALSCRDAVLTDSKVPRRRDVPIPFGSESACRAI